MGKINKKSIKTIAIILLFIAIIAIGYLFYPKYGESKILNGVPYVDQNTNYTCGPSALVAVMDYWGIDEYEDRVARLSGSQPDNGTIPENLMATALAYGLTAESRQNMTRSDLQQYINNGIPVIVLAQAWRNNTSVSWRDDLDDGHYMVVIGYNRTGVYLEDPATLGSRGYIPWDEFLDRWHDIRYNVATGKEEVYTHLGLIITGNRPAARPAFIYVELIHFLLDGRIEKCRCENTGVPALFF